MPFTQLYLQTTTLAEKPQRGVGAQAPARSGIRSKRNEFFNGMGSALSGNDIRRQHKAGNDQGLVSDSTHQPEAPARNLASASGWCCSSSKRTRETAFPNTRHNRIRHADTFQSSPNSLLICASDFVGPLRARLTDSAT